MPVRIKRASSRLTHAELVVVDGIEFWTRPELPDVEPDATDEYYDIEDNDRIEVIANMKYKRPDWWWVLAHRNDYGLLPNALTPGERVIVPRAPLIRKSLF